MLKNLVVQKIIPHAPNKLRTFMYKSLGLKNADNIRGQVFVQNLDALELGPNVFINRCCNLYNGFDSNNKDSFITIENNVTIGYGTSILTSTHEIGGGRFTERIFVI